jgi:hypothetical protein
MPAAFEQVAFSAPLQVLSEPVETDMGYHLIQVLEKKPAVKAELAKVENQIAEELLARDELEAQLTKLRTWMEEKKDSLITDWLRSRKLAWSETDWLDMTLDSIPGINAPEAFDVIAGLSPQKPYPNQFLESGGQTTLLRLKDFRSRPADAPAPNLAKKEAGKSKSGKPGTSLLDESQASLNLAQNRGSEIFRQWMNGEKKEAKIVRHTQALR